MTHAIRALFALVLAAPLAAAGPKNVILMIGDGMGHAQVEAGSLYRYGKPKAQPYWSWTYCPMSTYSANNQQGYATAEAWASFNYFLKMPSDSAAAATTLASGVKTRNGMIGVDPDGKPVRTLVEDAEAMGKATGILSTVRITHATPASFGAHVDARRKEAEIARQMLLESAVDLVMGPGHPFFDNDGKPLAAPDHENIDADLWAQLKAGTAGADANADGTPDPWTLVDTAAAIEGLDAAHAPARVLALVPVADTLQADRSGDTTAPAYAAPRNEGLPTMASMMRAALGVLARDPEGFFLMAEGGAIDWACHGNEPGRLVEEQIDFDDAVAAAAAWIEANSSWDDTLLLVTADHECGYVAGPGSDPEWKPLVSNGAGQMPGIEFKTKGHTNQLVPLFARGAGSERLAEYVTGEDPRLGKFVDNAGIAPLVRSVWR